MNNMAKEVRKYMSIERMGKSGTEIEPGTYIVVTEKVDGSNGSFRIDDTDIGMSVYSRKVTLNEHFTLNGFYNWVRDNVKKEDLNTDFIYYGEWLTSHHVQYKQEAYKQWYGFSIWSVSREMYIPHDEMEAEFKRLGLNMVKVLYKGEFISFEHLKQFVGISDIAIDKGEGIVIKMLEPNKFGNVQYSKIVAPEFAEVMKQKPAKSCETSPLKEAVNMCINEARVRKLVLKLQDHEVLKRGLTIKDMGVVLKAIGGLLYEDTIKEEPEMFKDFEESSIRRWIGKTMPVPLKAIITKGEV